MLCLNVYDCNGPQERHIVGGTTINLFGNTSKIFKQGQVKKRQQVKTCLLMYAIFLA